jgi:GNAT superfamily N-acetyltransferase
MVVIKEVTTRKQLRQFVNFTYRLYEDHPNFVPSLRVDEYQTLKEKKNPAFEHCRIKMFLAYKDNKVAGRIAVIINDLFTKKYNKKYGRFGFVDFIEDFEVASKLFEAAENYLKEQGMEGIHGPLGFCDLDPEGMLTSGFEFTGTFTTIYNYPYYPEYLKRLGYVEDAEWVEYELKIPETVPESIKNIAEYAKSRYGVSLMKFESKSEIKKIAPKIFDLINICYKDLYGVVELTEKQIDHYVDMYFSVIDPKYVRIIQDPEGEPIAFGLGFPSLTKVLQKHNGKLLPLGLFDIYRTLKNPSRLELILIAVRPDYKRKGINAILLCEMVEMCNKLGIQTVDLNPQLVKNFDVRGQWKYFESIPNKTRAAFFKSLA